jgi:hypothetical protein
MRRNLSLLTPLACALLALLFSASAAAQTDPHVTRRFALVVGANQGGRERAELRYAQRDARAIASVLEQLGGVERGDRVLLLEPSPEQLGLALVQLEQRSRAARASGQRTELLFYYSGHSDETGLLLGEDRYPYRALRDGLASVGTSVHVGVLDSCASGALTRLKGGTRRAPFLLDHSNAVQGHAFLTSSSADEGAQESDRVGASFFTHYLVSGLRGAADFSGDGRVTLNEAYRFAFDETLARTADTHAGPQHAAYDIQLVGTGDLVMTDLRQPAAALHLPKQLSGRLYLRDLRGNLVVELNKPGGRVVELALDAQGYQILLDQDGQLSRAGVELTANTTTVLKPEAFVAVTGERNRLRGDDRMAEGRCRTVGFGFGLFPPYSTNDRYRYASVDKPVCIKNHVSLHLVWGRVHQLHGVAFAFGGQQVRESARGAQFALGMNLAEHMDGAQFAVGVNALKDGSGAQFGVALNLAYGEYHGLQLGLNNLTERTVGAQLGLVNLGREVSGVQLGLVNGSERFRGLQLGLLNLSTQPEAAGLQFGLLNIGAQGMNGAQVGLVNYAERASGQFGLLSITRDGGVHPLVFMSDMLPIQAGIRFDADHTYGTIIAGVTPSGGDDDSYGVGFGFGGKIQLAQRLWLEPGFDAQQLGVDGKSTLEKPSWLGRVMVSTRYRFYNHLSVFASPVFQVLVHQERKAHDHTPGLFGGGWELTNEGGQAQVLASLGFVAGMSL